MSRAHSSSGTATRFLTFAVLTTLFMQGLDSTIANVALHAMSADLRIDLGSAAWVLNVYLAASTCATPAAIWLARRIGSSAAFLAALLVFAIASAVCGVTSNFAVLLIARAFQGAAAGTLVPTGQSFLFRNAEPSTHPKIAARFGTALVLGPMIGPLVGGFCVEHLTWRWAFTMNLPIAAAISIALIRYAQPSTHETGRPSDPVGMLGLLLTLLGVQALLSAHLDVVERTLLITAISLLVALLIRHLIRHPDPVLHLPTLKDRRFAISALLILCAALVTIGMLAAQPLLLHDLGIENSEMIGATIAARGLGTIAAMNIVPILLRHISVRSLACFGFLLMAAALGLTTTPLVINPAAGAFFNLCQGLGLGLVLTPITGTAYRTIPKDAINDASALFAFVRNAGSALGVALVFSISPPAHHDATKALLALAGISGAAAIATILSRKLTN